MGKLPITKKSQNNQNLSKKVAMTAAAEVITEVAARMLDRWTQKELQALIDSREFICVDVGKHLYRVGKFVLKKQHGVWIVKNQYGNTLHTFSVAPAAVLFCLYESHNLYHKAREFVLMDAALTKMSQEVTDYTHGLAQAVRSHNTFKQDLFLARLSISRPRLENLKTNMQKTIYSAKYSKVWETKNHETARTRN